MARLHEKSFPNESVEYREARDQLLQAELDLRRRVEDVAQMRRELPLGGRLKEDYLFDKTGGTVRLSELFAEGKDSLIVYSLMYRLGADPCPMCASFLDSLNGNAPHVMNKVNLVVVARSPIDRIDDFARGRGWGNLNLLSSTNNSYNSDYFAEKEDGRQDPMLTVFRRTADGIFHHWSSELFFAETEDGQHPRHVDTYWPLWNLFDLTPEGRGEDWWPQVDYG